MNDENISGTNILVMSDTHGNAYAIKQLLENYQGMISAVVHLGDYSRDVSRFAQAKHGSLDYHIVTGNTDPLVETYNERVVEIAGKKFFITHGHRYNVKISYDNIIYKALELQQELQVDCCLFGHTHIPALFTENGILFLNPGSPTYPQPGTDKGYALIRISDEGKVTGKLLTYREALWR